MSQTRRRFTSEQKAAILKEYLIDRVSVADLCDRHGVRLTLFYRWQKEAIENLPALFERSGESEKRKLRGQLDTLRRKLAHKDTVIAQIMEDFVEAKKTLGGD
jgi:transposase-like protein